MAKVIFDQFKSIWNGKYNNYDGLYGRQCTDLMRQYVKDVHGYEPYTAIPTTGAAKNIFNNFKSNKYFTKILNTPNNVPKKGDIIFWGWYVTVTGPDGHVAIYDTGDVFTFTSFDQNYPTGQPCKFVKHGSNKFLHGYRGCLGWLHAVK